jgi:hypothetical protein
MVCDSRWPSADPLASNEMRRLFTGLRWQLPAPELQMN